jgi:hypothetical protein
MSDVEIDVRVERRRKWTIEEKAALIAEVQAEGGDDIRALDRNVARIGVVGELPPQEGRRMVD